MSGVAREPVPRRDPVFLVGSERSGTTLLRLMLDHHPAIAFDKEADYMVTMVSDAGVLPSPQRYLEWVTTVRGMEYAVEPLRSYPELVNDFLRQKQSESGGKPHVGATIHRNFDRLRFLWPDARYIHLVRDPRDVARSVVQKGWAGNVYQGSEFWLDAERCWDALVRHLGDGQAIEVRYEELVTQTEQVLSAVCGFIGVDYSPEMLEYTADAPQYPPPDPAWRRSGGRSSIRATWPWWNPGSVPCCGRAAMPRAGIAARRSARCGTGCCSPRAGCSSSARASACSAFGWWRWMWSGGALHLRRLERDARARMNAIEQRMIDQESAGIRAPSANIAPAAHRTTDAGEPPAADYRPRVATSGSARSRDSVNARRARGQAPGSQSRPAGAGAPLGAAIRTCRSGLSGRIAASSENRAMAVGTGRSGSCR